MVLVAGSFALRFFLAIVTFGTNDVETWLLFQEHILSSGMIEVYRKVEWFNHPPLMGIYLWAISIFATPTEPRLFPFLIRLPAMLADGLSVWLVFQLFRHFWDEAVAWKASAMIAAAPLMVLVSGFHGNTDPVFMSLVLLTAYLLTVRKNVPLAGGVYGLSLSIKIVPVILVPLFFFWLKDWNKRFKFFVPVAVMVILGYGYHAYHDFFLIKRNIFDYESSAVRWGLTPLLHLVGVPPKFYVKFLKYSLLACICLKSWHLTKSSRHEPKVLLEGLAWSFMIFLLLSPGFGIQYLVWLAAPIMFFGMKHALRYTIITGVLAFSVYNNWSDGFPWYYAGSAIWNPWEWLLLYLVWIDLVKWIYRAQVEGEMARV